MLTDDDHIRLTATLLKITSEHFSQHGCNDFDLRAVLGFSDPAKQTELDRVYHEWNGDPEAHDPAEDHSNAFDFCIMSYLAAWWWKRAGTVVASEAEAQAAERADAERSLRAAEAKIGARTREIARAQNELAVAQRERETAVAKLARLR